MSPGRLRVEVRGTSLPMLVLQLLGREQGTCNAEENWKPLGPILWEWLFPVYPDVDGEVL